MLGKILLCPEGHGICANDCFATLPEPKKCPQCRQAFGTRLGRGIMVEQIIADGFWNCKHGCGLKCCGSEMANHLEECPGRPTKCPGCNDLVAPGDMAQHFTAKSHRLDNAKKTSGDGPWTLKSRYSYQFERSMDSAFSFGKPLELERTSSFSFGMSLEGSDELLQVSLRHLRNQSMAMIIYHCVSPRLCKVVLGGNSRCRVTLEFVTRPWKDIELHRVDAADLIEGLSLGVALLAQLAENGVIPVLIEVLPKNP
mmetsp:Transcript_38660/g.122899  ORF Transcript_38660/g.122899 Transcript_38660/m.122899 type:complete len:255 (+) Transcript_38660:165-929(+)